MRKTMDEIENEYQGQTIGLADVQRDKQGNLMDAEIACAGYSAIEIMGINAFSGRKITAYEVPLQDNSMGECRVEDIARYILMCCGGHLEIREIKNILYTADTLHRKWEEKELLGRNSRTAGKRISEMADGREYMTAADVAVENPRRLPRDVRTTLDAVIWRSCTKKPIGR